MYRNYKEDTQKGKIIQIMLRNSSKYYEDFEIENVKDLFVWNSGGARLSEMLKDWIVEVQYYENPNKWCNTGYHRAKYKLTDEAITFYKDIYGQYKAKLFSFRNLFK